VGAAGAQAQIEGFSGYEQRKQQQAYGEGVIRMDDVPNLIGGDQYDLDGPLPSA
jgi:hypothetical protein